MVNTKVVFLTGLNQAIIDEVVSYVPDNFDLTVFGKSDLEKDQIDAVKDADFLLCYGMEPTDNDGDGLVNEDMIDGVDNAGDGEQGGRVD